MSTGTKRKRWARNRGRREEERSWRKRKKTTGARSQKRRGPQRGGLYKKEAEESDRERKNAICPYFLWEGDRT
jgi:hypothetical protein